MGQGTSNVAKKISKSVSSYFTQSDGADGSAQCGRFAVTPYVFKRTRWGNNFFNFLKVLVTAHQ